MATSVGWMAGKKSVSPDVTTYYQIVAAELKMVDRMRSGWYTGWANKHPMVDETYAKRG